MVYRYVVRLTPVSKKNSQQIITNNRTGRPMVIPSKAYRDYEKNALWFLTPKPKNPIDFPVNLKCLFYMPTHRKCDLVNMLECIQDVLVKAGILLDDNFAIVESVDGSQILYDKDNPRTEILITGKDEEDD